MGVDVAAAGEGVTDQGVCFVVRAGYPVWTRTSRARAVAVLNGAMRMAWLISLVCTSRTCWPGFG